MFGQLEDVFMYANLDKVELTEIDTVRATATIRSTGEVVTVEDDDIDLVANEMARIVEAKVWLIDDILAANGLTLAELRDLVASAYGDFGYDASDFEYERGYSDGYYDAARMESARPSDDEVESMIAYAQSKSFDDGYAAGLRDSSFSDSDSYTKPLDEPAHSERDADFLLPDNLISMQSAVALAAQPFLARDPESDDLYIAYRIDS